MIRIPSSLYSSKFDGAGFTLLNYPDFAKWSALFKEPSSLDEGYYIMVSGSRLADGGVLGQVFFNVRKGEVTNENCLCVIILKL